MKKIFLFAFSIIAFSLSGQNSDQDLHKAKLELEKNNYELAMAYYSRYCESNPKSLEGLLGKAICNKYLEKFSESLSDFEKCLLIDSLNVQALYYIGVLYTDDFEKPEKAIPFFVKCLNHSKENIEKANACFGLGKSYYSSGNQNKAIEYYTQSAGYNPKFAPTYNNRGLCKQELKDYSGAIRDFDLAIKTDPKLFEAYLNRGRNKLIIKDNAGAEKDFLKVIEIDEKSYEGFYHLALINVVNEKYAVALELFSKAIEIEPMFIDAYYERGSVKIAMKDLKGALEDLSKAIELEPNDSESYLERGYVKFELNDFRSAIEDFTKAIELDPESAEAYYQRGLALFEMGEKEQACLDGKKAVELGMEESGSPLMERCK